MRVRRLTQRYIHSCSTQTERLSCASPATMHLFDLLSQGRPSYIHRLSVRRSQSCHHNTASYPTSTQSTQPCIHKCRYDIGSFIPVRLRCVCIVRVRVLDFHVLFHAFCATPLFRMRAFHLSKHSPYCARLFLKGVRCTSVAKLWKIFNPSEEFMPVDRRFQESTAITRTI
jgi:hypothetical protein